MDALQVGHILAGKNILLYGGTGFLGKVWLSLILSRFPQLNHIYLVVRARRKSNGDIKTSSETRFWNDIASSGALDPLREQYPGTAFTEFINQKITVVDGDVTRPFAGISEEKIKELKGKIDVLINTAGVVDFNPPLDKSLDVNAFGMQNLVSLAKELGDILFMHTSTCYVAGDRTGQVDEISPLEFPFPKADDLAPEHWESEREVEECMEMIRHAKRQATDAFRQSDFLDQARKNLKKKGEPTRGKALQDELSKVERNFIENMLIKEGTERAQFWGWHNIYTYTKSIGEQILCKSGLRFCIVRPAVIESAVRFPVAGWNEGINTSTPLIYLIFQGPLGVPTTKESVLDVIPVDLVAIGMILSLAELIEGTHKTVYQYGSSDSAPLKMTRLIELVSLQKRVHRREGTGNPIMDSIQQRIEAGPVSVQQYLNKGPRIRAEQLRWFKKKIKPLKKSVFSSLASAAVNGLESGAKNMDVIAKITDQFLPFTATHNYRFSCNNTRDAFLRLSEEEKKLLPWDPEKIDWHDYILRIHVPGIQKNVFPLIEEKRNKEKKPLRPYDHLLDLLDEVADRFGHQPALMCTHEDGFAQISYIELKDMAQNVAWELHKRGIVPGDLVLLSGQNHPNWAVCYFGILRAGAVVVPMDVALDPAAAVNIEESSGAKIAIFDQEAYDTFGYELKLPIVELNRIAEIQHSETAIAPTLDTKPETLASILYTSGTTGKPKGVMLSHANFTALLGSLARVFPLTNNDRVLSVLPLHHTFEFSCGLLLPISRGSRIIYLDELTGERLTYGLKEGKVTAMVGVPALWQLLERRISAQIKEKSPLFEILLEGAMDFNRNVGKGSGLDLGRVLFAPIHARMGGRIRYLISGGAALPKETHKFFSGLGMHLTEGYGLTEAAPVLSVSAGGPKAKAGTVGKAIPGVKLKIINADDKGIGEVVAKGPNVMQGYYNNDDATQQTLTEDGWLQTGDMGRIDSKGRLYLSGRAKEVVVTAAGENIYLDDVEQRIGSIRYLKEYVLVGVPDQKGGERLGLLGAVDTEEEGDYSSLKEKALEQIREKIEKLPHIQRPSVYQVVEAELPRTRTRKIKRKESQEILLRILAAKPQKESKSVNVSAQISKAIAVVCGVEESKIQYTTNLRDELGFDSLMAVELSSALSSLKDVSVESQQLEKCETVSEVISLVGQNKLEPKKSTEEEKVEIPSWIANPLKDAMGNVQMGLYRSILDTEVEGRSNIPLNRQVIAVSNHTSHLDMGLIKFALGKYGRKVVGLAAQDYFFEGNKWKVAYFSQLTNLAPIDRKKGYRKSIRQAKEIVESGNIALIFPEGTRQTSGQIAEFRPMVGQLSLETGVDILPMYLDGAYDILPKGSFVPKGSKLQVRIGPPIPVRSIQEWLPNLKSSALARIIAKITQFAVEELRDGRVYYPTKADMPRWHQERIVNKTPIERSLDKLRKNYDPDRIKKPLSWYFSLDGQNGARYTISVDTEKIDIQDGKPTNGRADCVIKTTSGMLSRMILDAYVPAMSDFAAGKVKTNAPHLLFEFQKVFNLQESS
ncbi:MAG: AMP-binding protein [Myxococcota bacterium]|nr:AMP-binding protein [Myxococcota bacterium]